VVTALASFVFWRWMGAPVDLPDVPGARLQCLSYTPFEPRRIGYNPQGIVSEERIEADMAALAPLTGCIRIYSAFDPARDIVQAAERHGIRVLLGAWIGGRRQARQNRQQIDEALALAARYPETVSAIIVGNEVLLRREMTGAQLANLIRSVKARSPVPVTYADVDHFVKVNPEVAAAVDFVMIHILPYWNDPVAPGIEEVLPYVERRVTEFRTQFPGKEVMIGETGWPSEGRRRGRAQPSLVNQARYLRMFASRAEAKGLRYNLIEAIDQPWKRVPEGTVGGYWGVLDQFRAQKFPLTGPVSEWPLWRWSWGVTLIISAAVLFTGTRGRHLSIRVWTGLAVLAAALGIGLVLQWEFVATTSQSLGGWIARLTGMALSIAGTALIVAHVTGVGVSRSATLAELVRTLGRPRRIVLEPGLRLAAFAALVLLSAAYISINLALAPRHLDIPAVLFALPAIALAFCRSGFSSGPGVADRREEALLASIILICGLMQLEASNPETWAWTAICLLLSFSQLSALRAEARRLRNVASQPRESEQRQQHAER
jgi:glucan 1,3-beta-glucosidase